jgi:hypothetical protein
MGAWIVLGMSSLLARWCRLLLLLLPLPPPPVSGDEDLPMPGSDENEGTASRETLGIKDLGLSLEAPGNALKDLCSFGIWFEEGAAAVTAAAWPPPLAKVDEAAPLRRPTPLLPSPLILRSEMVPRAGLGPLPALTAPSAEEVGATAKAGEPSPAAAITEGTPVENAKPSPPPLPAVEAVDAPDAVEATDDFPPAPPPPAAAAPSRGPAAATSSTMGGVGDAGACKAPLSSSGGEQEPAVLRSSCFTVVKPHCFREIHGPLTPIFTAVRRKEES